MRAAPFKRATAEEVPSTYEVYDVETTTRSSIGFPASPFCLENKIVLSGVKYNTGAVLSMRTYHNWALHPEAKLYVGANIKFDLLWAARASDSTPAKLVQGAAVWDVCLAEYILQRQRIRMPSLEQCAEYRGIAGKKEEIVHAQIKSGICPSTIDPVALENYNKQDLELTEQVFLSQFQEAKDRGMLPLIWSQMGALVGTAEMEWNGLHIDRKELEDLRTVLQRSMIFIETSGGEALLRTATHELPNDAAQYICSQGKSTADIFASTKDLSLLFFGGDVTIKERIKDGKYKNGKDKYKTVDKTVTLRGFQLQPSPHGSEVNGNGWYTVDEKVLKSIATAYPVSPVGGLANTILAWREHSKQLFTYVDGVSKCIWPGEVVHCNFNHTVTLTGRLSCSGPNLQNQTDGPIKKVYVPRDAEGYFIEFDYAQLEIYGLAILSGDAMLIDDLRSGRDIHSELYKDMYGRLPTKDERKRFKPLTFGLVYGAGANTLAENAGVDNVTAKKFVATFYKRYPEVLKYHNELRAAADRERTPGRTKTEKGLPSGEFVLRLRTGREFLFRQYDSPYMRGEASFSPTELKNWPVQGFATGDIVPLVIGEVVKAITASEWYGLILPVATVHDSIMFELTKDCPLGEALNFLRELMSNTRQYIIDRFGFDPGLDFATEYKVGKNWKEMA